MYRAGEIDQFETLDIVHIRLLVDPWARESDRALSQSIRHRQFFCETGPVLTPKWTAGRCDQVGGHNISVRFGAITYQCYQT